MQPSTKRKRTGPPASYNHPAVSSMLADGAGVRTQATEGVTPTALHGATANGQTGLVRALIAAGADVDANCHFPLNIADHESQECSRVTPLAVAVAHKQLDIAQALIAAGAKLDPITRDYDEHYPLIHLAIEGQSRRYHYDSYDAATMVKMLLNTSRCDVNETYKKIAPLHAAIGMILVEHGDDGGVLRHLLAHPNVDLEAGQDSGYGTPLHYASSYPLMDWVVKELLDCRASADVTSTFDIDFADPGLELPEALPGVQPLHVAALHGCTEAVELLVEKAVNVDAYCGSGFTPLMLAAMRSGKVNRGYGEHVNGATCTIPALLAAQADVNARRDSPDPDERQTPLYYALKYGHGDAGVQHLLDNGADWRMVAADPAEILAVVLLEALCEDTMDAKIMALVRSQDGPDILGVQQLPGGQPVLIALARQGCEHAVMAMVAAGADAAVTDERGYTILQTLLEVSEDGDDAAWKGNISAETVATLVKTGDRNSWDWIPYNFEGLGCLLGYIQKHAPQHLGKLFKSLPSRDQAAFRTALRTLNRLLPGGEDMVQLRFNIVAEVFS